MAEGSVPSLLARRCALNDSLSAVGQQVKQAMQSQKDSRRRRRNIWQLTSWQSKVVLIIYVLAGYATSPAVIFLLMEAGKRKWPRKPEEELRETVEQLFLAADVDWVAGLSGQVGFSDAAAVLAANSFLREWAVAEWVQKLNRQRGVAPPTEVFLEQLEQRRLDFPEHFRPGHVGFVGESKARMWARRWRKRWGARHGKVRIRGEDISPSEMRDKAGSRFLTLVARKRARKELHNQDPIS